MIIKNYNLILTLKKFLICNERHWLNNLYKKINFKSSITIKPL